MSIASGSLGPRVRWAFADRTQGVSLPPYDSGNLADHVGDDITHVLANRAALAAVVGVDGGHVVSMAPVHGNDVAQVGGRRGGAGPRGRRPGDDRAGHRAAGARGGLRAGAARRRGRRGGGRGARRLARGALRRRRVDPHGRWPSSVRRRGGCGRWSDRRSAVRATTFRASGSTPSSRWRPPRPPWPGAGVPGSTCALRWSSGCADRVSRRRCTAGARRSRPSSTRSAATASPGRHGGVVTLDLA